MNAMIPRTAAEEALGLSLPSRRDEDWKWTDLKRLVNGVYAPLAVETKPADIDRLLASSPFAKLKLHRAVFVNGIFEKARSNVDAEDNASPLHLNDNVIAIAAALQARGITLKFSGNMDAPIEIIHVTTDGLARAMATRNRIEVADGASATIIETHIGDGDYLAAHVTDIVIGEGARLDRVKVELESTRATHLSHVTTELGKNGIFRDMTFTNGAALNRQNGTISFNGTGGDAKVAGAYLLHGRQHADTKLVVDHKVPHCVSRELFKCVMDGQSRGIFQGKVIVRPDAQKTDGKQSSHALLLTEQAEFDAKPELEIYADDVVCGHGATSGDLNHDHMFYLKSRGIPEAEAKSLLISAFVGEAIDTVEREDLREALLGFAEGWVGRT